MELHILIENKERIVGVYESYDYAKVMKAKLEHANPENKYYINNQDLIEGDLSADHEGSEGVRIENQDCETIAFVEVKTYLYEGAKPSYMIGDKIVEEYYHEFKLESALIFGDTVEALGVSEELTRWINNEVDNCIYELNEE